MDGGEDWTAEKTPENGRNKELYNIAKAITGDRKREEVGVKQALGVKDKQGVLKGATSSFV